MRSDRYPAVLLTALLLFGLVQSTAAFGQVANEPPATAAEPTGTGGRIAVENAASDDAIAARLTRIYRASAWFEGLDVRVDEGIVFLQGTTRHEDQREWAARVARNTDDVVAVVNDIAVAERPLVDVARVWQDLRRLTRAALRSLPVLAVSLAVVLAAWFAARFAAGRTRRMLGRRMPSRILRDVAARFVAIPVFLAGVYIALQVSGLTALAATIIGGTGLIGLVVGFAFRDIAENFLASVLISIQHPFARGDLISVAGFTGYVQGVNMRSTLLMTLEGNHVQLPNSTIYKDTITNLSANPNTRYDFRIGIGYEDSVERAQAVILAAVHENFAVLTDPEPLVLIEELGAATVNLRVYYWIDVTRHSHIKVRSAVIRVVKFALEQAGISMPDEAREVVFPAGVPVRVVERGDEPITAPAGARPQRRDPHPRQPDAPTKVQRAEGGLASDAGEIERQANRARTPEGAANLLD